MGISTRLALTASLFGVFSMASVTQADINKNSQERRVYKFQPAVFDKNGGCADLRMAYQWGYAPNPNKKQFPDIGHPILVNNKKISCPDHVGDRLETYSYPITVPDDGNLSMLSKELGKFLGNGITWQNVYQRNVDVIGKNPDLIQPGTVLKYDIRRFIPGKIVWGGI